MSSREDDAANILIPPSAVRSYPGMPTEGPTSGKARSYPGLGGATTYTPPTPGPAEPVEGQTSEAVQRAARVASQGYRSTAEQRLRDMGINTGDFRIQYFLDSIDANAEAYNDGSANFEADMAQFMQNPVVQELLPDYQRAVQASGFSGQPFIEVGVTTPSEVAGVPSYQTITKGEQYQVQPDTGWIQYANGVLVDPNQPLGSPTAVFFQPGFTGPGTKQWQYDIQSWGQDKVNDWRAKLVEMGYLTGAKKGPADAAFVNAMTTYWTVRYQNRGKELPWDTSAAAGGQAPFNFRQLHGQIENGVTEEFRALYGEDPTKQELERWTQRIIETSRKLYERGQLSAPGAVAEAEERFIQGVESTPEAEFVTENFEENTRMRDVLLRSVQVAESMES